VKLEGEVAVVIGAGGGVGAEICRVLAAEGAQLAIADRDLQPLARLDDELGAFGQALDAIDPEAVAAFADETAQRVGTPSILVNCLGVWHAAPFNEVSDEDWRRVVDANLTSIFVTCRAFVPGMQELGRGSVVNFSSTAGEYGSIRPAAHYAAAKGGVIAFSKSLAREVSPSGVRVNVVSPGPLDTPMLGAIDEAQKRRLAERTLVGRLGLPRDIAEAVLYLASSQSSFVTGHVLGVSGGALL